MVKLQRELQESSDCLMKNNDPLAPQSDHLAHGHDLLLGDLWSRVCVCHDPAGLSRESCVLFVQLEPTDQSRRAVLTDKT